MILDKNRLRTYTERINVIVNVARPEQAGIPNLRRTLKQLARDLNVSTMTVSRALRGDSGVGEETRARIRGYAKQVNYHPDLVARSLVARRTQAIGIIIPNLRHSFWLDLVIAVERIVRESGYNVVLTHSDDSPERELSEIETLVSRRMDALMIASCAADCSAGALRRVEAAGVPVLVFDRYADGFSEPGVFTDDVAGARTAVNHLVGLGRRRIAHLAGDRQHSPSRERLQGYTEAIEQAGLRPIIINAGYGEESGFNAMNRLLDWGEADAVFAVHDYSAIGALNAARTRGARVPEDISVVGFGNTDCASHVPVPLTTIAQPTKTMGEELARLALLLIADKSAHPARVIVPTRLVVRNSCGAASCCSGNSKSTLLPEGE